RPLPETLRVTFDDIKAATDRRQIYAKQRKKKKIKPYELTVRPVDSEWADDPRLRLLVSTTETEGIDAVFTALAQVPGNVEFEAKLPEGGVGVCAHVLVL
ncbi:MAG: hypothetical protein H6816_00005, partial [Phycisphaerales bacterium]|nr:hypothetical protein [Phycisphaerales bacterium]